ncbi:MAG: glutamate--cysteine ligase [Deltaproteobacteria bacterium]|nr:glutamate--cysteine ligase [Deltaproteobacteria bacterium]
MKRQRNFKISSAMHGFEKEGIRITPEGFLSPTLHPEGLGSSLMNPYITTDFTEPQLEFRTSPSDTLCLSLHQLKQIHIYTTKALKDECIWPFSMPPELPAKEEDIPLAVYGSSALGKKKTVYRRGIGFRYGRRKLTISGVHYNFSLDLSWFKCDFPGKQVNDDPLSIPDCYFNIIRNLHRKIFYLTYLFGASPAFDKSFKAPGINRFKRHKSSTYYGEFVTSFRASEIGYTSEVQNQLPINYDSLEAYIKSLGYAVFTCNPDYLKISSHACNQLNPNYLQTEHELYAHFRPKQQMDSGVRLLDALEQKGVGYLELRLPDIDPEYPEGIDPYTMGFLHLMILDCLMNESPPLTNKESKEIHSAHQEIIWNGRKKGIGIIVDGKSRPFHDAGKKYCEGLYRLAEKMDQGKGSDFYQESLKRQIGKWESPELTPSGKLLSDLLDNNREFIESGVEIADKNVQYFSECKYDPDFREEIETQTLLSVKLQRKLEACEE